MRLNLKRWNQRSARDPEIPPSQRQYAIYRSVLIIISAVTLLAALLLIEQFVMSRRITAQLSPMERHHGLLIELNEVFRTLERDGASAHAKTADRLEALTRRYPFRDASTKARLLEAASTLRSEKLNQKEAAVALAATRQILRGVGGESRWQYQALQSLKRDAGLAMLAGMALTLVVAALTALLALFFRRRVKRALDALGYLMDLLAAKEYMAARLDGLDPGLRPLFEKYNRMVEYMLHDEIDHLERERQLTQDVGKSRQTLGAERLQRAGAEAGFKIRENALKQDVDAATEALLQQQVALARAERLAALGDLSGRFAHKLRNPLSGVLMALNNLTKETPDPETQQRLGACISELERVVQMLNRMLADVRNEPEPSSDLILGEQVGELLTLLRYQIPKTIYLENRVPPQLRCTLPESALRNALLNLLLNAANAIQGGSQDGWIEVHARVDGTRLEIEVSDNGPGFPQDVLDSGPRDYLTRSHGGTGLGLAMVRRFVEHQWGRLELENRDQGGARVRLNLPRNPE